LGYDLSIEEQWNDDADIASHLGRLQQFKRRIRYFFRGIWGLFFLVVFAFALVILIRRLIEALLNPVGHNLIIVSALLFGGIAVLLVQLLIGRRWWVFPGGLLYRRDIAWRRKTYCRTFFPESTPLLLDFGGGIGFVVDDGRVRRFAMGEQTRWGLLAAWVSSARRPSRKELLSFLGMQDRV
jgi:hypothetical protein